MHPHSSWHYYSDNFHQKLQIWLLKYWLFIPQKECHVIRAAIHLNCNKKIKLENKSNTLTEKEKTGQFVFVILREETHN